LGRTSWFIFDKTENKLPDYFRLDGGVSYTNGKFGINYNVNNILSAYLYSGAQYDSEPAWGVVDRFYWDAEPKINSRITVSYKF
jgi:iron complex outermembrane receptor protein